MGEYLGVDGKDFGDDDEMVVGKSYHLGRGISSERQQVLES